MRFFPMETKWHSIFNVLKLTQGKYQNVTKEDTRTSRDMINDGSLKIVPTDAPELNPASLQKTGRAPFRSLRRRPSDSQR